MNTTLAPLAVLATATLAAAQAAASPTLSSAPAALGLPPVPIHGAAPDGGKPYGLWAATDSYKASFDGDVTFVPYLGAAWPDNQPLAWRTASVRVGDVPLTTAPRPRRSHSDFRCEIDHGGVVERWDVLPHGLEQSFVLAARPVGGGDLVVTGLVTTPLRGSAVTGEHRAIDFRDAAGTAVVRYGEAFAFDARGERTAATTTFAGGSIELRVAAAWLEHATYPVVLDPLLTRVATSPGLAPASIDVARDDTGNDLMTVYTRSASASDDDAFAFVTNDAWGGVTTVFTDVTASWSTPVARVATAADPQHYCVVIERHLPERRIRAHLHDSGDVTLSTSVVFVSPGVAGTHDWRPDIGGQTVSTSAFTSTGTRFLIVFQRDVPPGGVFQDTGGSAIFGRTLDANGTLGAEFPIALGVLTPQDHELPCVNQQARRTGSAVQRTDWFVVFQRYVGADATWRTIGRLVSDAGNVQSGTWSPSASGPAQHHLTPNVAGQSGRYVVGFVQTSFAAAPFKTGATTGHTLVAERVDWVPGSAPVNHAQRTLEGPHAQADLRLGGIAYDTATSSHWAITAASDRGPGGNGDALVLRTGYQALETERQVLYAALSVVEQGLAGSITFDDDAAHFATAFGRDTGTNGTVYGNRFAYGTPAPLAASGVACSSAAIGWNGSQQIGAQFPGVVLANAPATVPAIAGVSLGTIDANLSFLGMTGCRLLIDTLAPNFITTFTTVTSASGSASIAIPLPETLPNVDLWFQWFHFDLGANPLDLVSTQRLRVEIHK